MYYVIGSGPSGVACAQAFADAGVPITILDPGLTLELERQIQVAALGLHDEPDWSASELAVIAPDAVPPGRGSMPTKLVHGSDYPYRVAPGATELRQSGGLNMQRSCAAGGFSNVWGGAILPYRQDDLAGWPISVGDLELAFTRIANLLPMSGEADSLAELFPLYGASPTPLRQSRQSKRFMTRLVTNRTKLEAAGLVFGRSRLAVDAEGSADLSSCIYCARCLHGCPRDLIYSTRKSLKSLVSQGKVIYQCGVSVRSIEERNDHLEIRAIGPNGSSYSFAGRRVFLAAGVLNSTAILLRSQNQFDRPVIIKDSQYFIFPLLQFAAAKGVVKERLHTLCQVFLEISDARISNHLIHLQIYSYNDHMAAMLDRKLGPLKVLFPRESLLGHLLLTQAYLHSDDSPSIKATLRQGGGSDALHLEPIGNAQTKGKIARVLNKLRRLSGAMGATPFDPLLQITEPGRGFHSGGSFPMAEAPGPGQTDRLGRPYGMTRCHVVDATIFPSIPAPTITFTVMANAYRIGRTVLTADAGEA